MPTKRALGELHPVPEIQTHAQASLRPLLPKKGWEPLSKPLAIRAQRKVNPIKTCPAPGCLRVKCNLSTHRQYTRAPRPLPKNPSLGSSVSSLIAVPDTEPTGPEELSTGPTRAGASNLVPKVALHGLEGLPDFVGETPLLRSLFHEFCTHMYDRLTILLNPPPVTVARRNAVIARAMSSQVYCLNAIACVSNDNMMRRKHGSGDRIAAVLYGKTTSLLREKVANFEISEIDNLLTIIMTVALFDIVHHNLTNLTVHRQGMVQLVTRIGGVHNLTTSLAIVLHLDRIFAIYTGVLPLYARQIDRSIQKPSKYPEVYASFFGADSKDCVEQDVGNFCSDVSRTLELFEGAKISFDPEIANMPVASADVLYFYFSRERVANDFTHLNHKYWNQSSRSRCVLLATKIVDYTILVDNYIRVIPKFLASKLKETLYEMKGMPPDQWQGYNDVLLWVLFVLVTTLGPTSEDEWPLEYLRMTLLVKCSNFFSREWKAEELRNMKRFVWCNSRLDGLFLEVCDKLDNSFRIDYGDPSYGRSAVGKSKRIVETAR